MNSPVNALRAAGLIFGLVSVGQLCRVILGLDVAIAGWHVPLWLSGVAVVFAGGLSVWMWKSAADLASTRPAAPGGA